MKLKLFTFALLALLVAGCTDNINLPEPDENDVSENEVRMVTISANMSPETRVSYTENPNNTITVAWEEDDQLMLVGFDDNNEYKGKSIFSKSGTGNEFSGLTIADATKYKAYYPADAVQMDPLYPDKVLLDPDGNVPVPGYEFWEQTQIGDNNTSHINKHLYMSDEAGKAITEDFQMNAKSSIIKFVLSGIPTDLCLTKIVWKTEKTQNGYTHWAALNISEVAQGTTSLIAHLAFNPDDMMIGKNARVKVMLIGLAKSYEYVATLNKIEDVTYEAGKRYTAAVNMGWAEAKSEFTFVINTNKNTKYDIWLKEASTTSPANLTIYWGDGNTTPIAKNANLTNGTLASHTYATKSEHIITIYSDVVDPDLKQMPQITFYKNNSSDKDLKAVLTPFPNMDATDFSNCFYGCKDLVSIPAGLFHNNTRVYNFYRCCCSCPLLYIAPNLFPPAGSDFFANREQPLNWIQCFEDVGEKLSEAGTAPPLWTYERGGQWQYTDCFKGATNLINYSSIPASWGGGLAGQ
ncbi:MAG: hypothetical protein QM237_05145 [Bacteroidota bacterium]|mgnify:CR=1 FL=1|jgi:hypothetical protein|nr:hypothetical protein [Bacteroidota bacterium]HHU95702.1 hypothetical protein [Petrimonas sp.]